MELCYLVQAAVNCNFAHRLRVKVNSNLVRGSSVVLSPTLSKSKPREPEEKYDHLL